MPEPRQCHLVFFCTHSSGQTSSWVIQVWWHLRSSSLQPVNESDIILCVTNKWQNMQTWMNLKMNLKSSSLQPVNDICYKQITTCRREWILKWIWKSETIITSISGRALRALNSVMVLPLPGGPQSTSGLCSASQVYSSDSWRTVSIVGTTTSGAATLWVSTSICGTLDCHRSHSPWIVTYLIQHPSVKSV